MQRDLNPATGRLDGKYESNATGFGDAGAESFIGFICKKLERSNNYC